MPYTMPQLTKQQRLKLVKSLESIGSSTNASILVLFVVRDGLLECEVIADSPENLMHANNMKNLCRDAIASQFKAPDTYLPKQGNQL